MSSIPVTSRVEVLVAPPEEVSRRLAVQLLTGVKRCRAEGRRYLLGVPAGRTMRPVLAALAEQVRSQDVSLDHVVIVMMDEYLDSNGLGGQPWRRVAVNLLHSCRGFGEREVLAPLNAATTRPIPADALWSPDPAEPDAYDAAIEAAGGIEVFLVAVGASDGHVAFNGPGTALTSRTRIVELAETTRRDNLGTFPHFGQLERVPTHGVTVGLGTIAASRHVIALLRGRDKHSAWQRLTAASDFDPAFPGTVIHRVPGALLAADQAAAEVEH